jgi:hypothetical protein
MNTEHFELQAVRENNTNQGGRRIQAVSGREERKPRKTAADGQIAEIERTFTARYEW